MSGVKKVEGGFLIDLDEIGKRIGEYRIQVKDHKDDEWYDYPIQPMAYVGIDGANTDAKGIRACGKYYDVKVIKLDHDKLMQEKNQLD